MLKKQVPSKRSFSNEKLGNTITDEVRKKLEQMKANFSWTEWKERRYAVA